MADDNQNSEIVDAQKKRKGRPKKELTWDEKLSTPKPSKVVLKDIADAIAKSGQINFSAIAGQLVTTNKTLRTLLDRTSRHFNNITNILKKEEKSLDDIRKFVRYGYNRFSREAIPEKTNQYEKDQLDVLTDMLAYQKDLHAIKKMQMEDELRTITDDRSDNLLDKKRNDLLEQILLNIKHIENFGKKKETEKGLGTFGGSFLGNLLGGLVPVGLKRILGPIFKRGIFKLLAGVFAGISFVSGYGQAEKIVGKGRNSFKDKIQAGISNIFSNLTLGLINPKTISGIIDDIGNLFKKNVWPQIKNVFEKLPSSIANTWKEFKSGSKSIWEDVKKSLGNVWDKIKPDEKKDPIYYALVENFKNNINFWEKMIQGAYEEAAPVSRKWRESIKGAAKNLFGGMIDADKRLIGSLMFYARDNLKNILMSKEIIGALNNPNEKRSFLQIYNDAQNKYKDLEPDNNIPQKKANPNAPAGSTFNFFNTPSSSSGSSDQLYTFNDDITRLYREGMLSLG